MKHSEIISLIEDKIDNNLLIIGISSVSTVNVQPGMQIKQGYNTNVGLYGVATLQVMIPLQEEPDPVVCGLSYQGSDN